MFIQRSLTNWWTVHRWWISSSFERRIKMGIVWCCVCMKRSDVCVCVCVCVCVPWVVGEGKEQRRSMHSIVFAFCHVLRWRWKDSIAFRIFWLSSCSFCSRCSCLCACLYACVCVHAVLQIWTDGDAMVYCPCTCTCRSLHFRRRVKIVAGDVSVETISSRDKLVDGQLTMNIQ